MPPKKANKRTTVKTQKQKIPLAVKRQAWVNQYGPIPTVKCAVAWCTNQISPFDFEAGHNIPESKGGQCSVENIIPICKSCNRSMSDNFTIDQFSKEFQKPKKRCIIL